MTETNVSPKGSASEPHGWAAKIAAELHRVADDFAKVADAGLPRPRSVGLAIQPGGPAGKADDDVIGTVDAIGLALLGKPGHVDSVGRDGFHYNVDGCRDGVNVAVYREISTARVEQIKAGEVLAAKESELAALRAEVQQLRAAAALTPDATPAGWATEQCPEDGVLTHQVPPTDPDDLPADPVGRAVSMARAWGAATPEDAARLLRAWDHRPKLTDAEIASVLDVLFPS